MDRFFTIPTDKHPLMEYLRDLQNNNKHKEFLAIYKQGEQAWVLVVNNEQISGTLFLSGATEISKDQYYTFRGKAILKGHYSLVGNENLLKHTTS